MPAPAPILEHDPRRDPRFWCLPILTPRPRFLWRLQPATYGSIASHSSRLSLCWRYSSVSGWCTRCLDGRLSASASFKRLWPRGSRSRNPTWPNTRRANAASTWWNLWRSPRRSGLTLSNFCGRYRGRAAQIAINWNTPDAPSRRAFFHWWIIVG